MSALPVPEACVCKKSRIDITGTCVICGLPRLHVNPKVPLATRIPQGAAE